LGSRQARAFRNPRKHIIKADAISYRSSQSVQMLFAHLKRILKLDRLRLRGLGGATNALTLVAIAQNLRRPAKLVPQGPRMQA
jgi:hypothetical protein